MCCISAPSNLAGLPHRFPFRRMRRDWPSSYPTGAALPGGFYIHYHSYRYIWPLLALAQYRNKFQP